MPGAIADQAQRERGIDPLCSFCVTAPAGSGKTELLIQRFLKLLSRVDNPEELLAITFTRKAAAEMRARVVEALLAARDQERPRNSHSALTWQLAREALQRDLQCGWELLHNPGRLAIRTIDSFCASLTRQLPVLSGFGGAISPVDDCMPAYRQATRALLSQLGGEEGLSQDLSRLLLQFDDNWPRLEELLISMLRCRDQWLVHMGRGLQPAQAQAVLVNSVTMLVEDGLERCATLLGDSLSPLVDALVYSREQLGLPLPPCLSGDAVGDLDSWKGMAELCLTGKDEWRKAVNKNQGFPTGAEAAKQRKQDFLELLGELRSKRGLLAALQEVKALPVMSGQDEHWQLLLAVSRLLPRLAAELTVAFQQHGEVDHTQVAMAALEALGPDDAITDLAQKLDYRLRHILVDEFQDTAVTQYALLQRLTRGWAEENQVDPENPRTLFIVGDGMQSIYGFRDADVGLFVRARESGFNGIRLEPLELCCNFRSDQGLVDWVNRVFGPAFPARDNMRLGEIRFSPAVAERPALVAQPENLQAFDVDDDGRVREAAWLADRVEEGLADPGCESMAVLVRTRNHLLPLIDELKARGIDWQAQEIDPLANSLLVRDLQTLCRALHNHSDRVSWLGLLRAPWCGLSLVDLLRVSSAASEQSIYQALHSVDGLSAEGATAVARVCRALDAAEYWRERLGLRDWIESTWLSLGGPASAHGPSQLQDAAEFLALLEELDNRGQPYDELALQEQVSSLYSSASSGDSKLQLMTLHKAKGLEFDWVFIPGLARTPRQDQRELLLWDDYHRDTDSELGFMLAVDDGGDSADPTLYNYLHRLKKLKRQREATRLLYVGVTRAVQRLFLSTELGVGDNREWKAPPQSSLLHAVWEQVSPSLDAPVEPAPLLFDQSAAQPAGTLLRIAGLPALPPRPDPDLDPADRNMPDPPGDPRARRLGIVIHLSLERLSALDDDALAKFDCDSLRDWWTLQLRRRGLQHGELQGALEQVRDSVAKVLADERGRHIISASREQARSELALSSLRHDGRLAEYVIDRTYIEDNQRWVVDYKSSVPDSGQSLEAFLAAETERYRPQLQGYATLLGALDRRPVRTALYFTAIPHWLELDLNAGERT